jgi:uncharacterized protein (TIRG00374 family)
LAWRGDRFVRLVARAASRLAPHLAERVRLAAERFIEALRVVRSAPKSLLVVGLTLMIWLIEAAAVKQVMEALNLHLPNFAAFFVVVVVSVSALIPAAPGALGTYEFFTILALVPFSVDHTRAVGLGLVLHGLNYVIVGLLGFGSMLMENLSISELKRDAPVQREPD